MKRLAAAKNVRLTVGVHEEEGARTYQDGATVAEVATYNELGLGVPRRSFIADWVDETEDAKKSDLRAVGKKLMAGGDAKASLGQLGERYSKQVVDRMSSLKPDDPETAEHKGGNDPLEETGLLKSSIGHRVKSEGGPETNE